jgi:hypothetical protein
MPIAFITKNAKDTKYDLEELENKLLESKITWEERIGYENTFIAELEKNGKIEKVIALKQQRDAIIDTIEKTGKNVERYGRLKQQKSVDYFTLSDVSKNDAEILSEIITNKLKSKTITIADEILLTNLLTHVIVPYLNGMNQSHPILTEEKNLVIELIQTLNFKQLNSAQEKYELFLNSASNNQLTVKNYL